MVAIVGNVAGEVELCCCEVEEGEECWEESGEFLHFACDGDYWIWGINSKERGASSITVEKRSS